MRKKAKVRSERNGRLDLDWRDDVCQLVVVGSFLKDGRSTVKDKDAMEKAAAMYVSGPDCEISDTFSSHCDTFEAGWQAAHSGPKVMALVDALRKVRKGERQDADMEGTPVWRDFYWYEFVEIAEKALAEFEASSKPE